MATFTHITVGCHSGSKVRGNSLTEVWAACRKPPFMKSKAGPKYQRILLKLSGEALGGKAGMGIDAESVTDMARQIREVRELGVEVVVVIGGGNIFRGVQ